MLLGLATRINSSCSCLAGENVGENPAFGWYIWYEEPIYLSSTGALAMIMNRKGEADRVNRSSPVRGSAYLLQRRARRADPAPARPAASGASVGAGAGAGAKPGRLNVPAGMAGSLRLDASSPASSSSSVARLLEIPKTPSPSKVTYSDRFIPCRTSSRLHNFALADRPSPGSGSRDDGSAYSRLLRAELFGDASSPGGDKQDTPGANNLVRFKTDRSSAPFSPFAEKLDCAGGAGSPTPKKAPRKVPKTPHKVRSARPPIPANTSRTPNSLISDLLLASVWSSPACGCWTRRPCRMTST